MVSASGFGSPTDAFLFRLNPFLPPVSCSIVLECVYCVSDFVETYYVRGYYFSEVILLAFDDFI